jgi:DNA-binding FadR family transcriptional regulator
VSGLTTRATTALPALIAAAMGGDGTGRPREPGRSAEGDTRAARRIAATIGRLITSGDLPVGTRLPTVRELSRRLGVSPTTVSEAWRSLADVGAIETRGRSGTYVRRPPAEASRGATGR